MLSYKKGKHLRESDKVIAVTFTEFVPWSWKVLPTDTVVGAKPFEGLQLTRGKTYSSFKDTHL